VLIEGFGELAAHAEQVEVVIALEPLNRYENHMINTLAQAAALCAEIGSPWFGIAADTYHMNIEEADPIKALFESRSGFDTFSSAIATGWNLQPDISTGP
jgi:sugar phosphate isomerase/epimerase